MKGNGILLGFLPVDSEGGGGRGGGGLARARNPMRRTAEATRGRMSVEWRLRRGQGSKGESRPLDEQWTVADRWGEVLRVGREEGSLGFGMEEG